MHSAALGTVFGASPAVGIALYGSVAFPAQNLVLKSLSNGLTRGKEVEADEFAARQGYGEDLASALTLLMTNSNQHPSYSWLYEFLHLDHPTTVHRLQSVRAAMAGVWPAPQCEDPATESSS